MFFGKNIKKQVRDLCLKNPNEEICGLIIFTEKGLEIEKCKNDSSQKFGSFQLNVKDYLKCSLKGEIIGVFHGHPQGSTNLSELDKINLNGHNLKFLIYSIKEDSFMEHEPSDYQSPYIGREFIWGKQDCFSLISDYYKKELNINLKNYLIDRNSKIFEKVGGFEFKNHENEYNKHGFTKICNEITENTKLIKNDLLIIKNDKNIAGHAAIYLDGGKILHQPRNHFSLIEDLTENIRKKIIEIIRPKC